MEIGEENGSGSGVVDQALGKFSIRDYFLAVSLGVLAAAASAAITDNHIVTGLIFSLAVRLFRMLVAFILGVLIVSFWVKLRSAPKTAQCRSCWTGFSAMAFYAQIFSLAGLLGLTIPPDDFPRNAPLAARDDWAKKKFGQTYEEAVQFVKNSEVIRKEAGEDLTVGPAMSGLNRASISRDAFGGEFTLEVQGRNGTGICTYSTFESYHSRVWRFGERSVVLK